MKKRILEVIPKTYEYDDSLSKLDNKLLAEVSSLSPIEYFRIIRTFWNIIQHCKLENDVKIQDYGNNITVIGFIPEDVMGMFEEVLQEYTNDYVDKLDYAIGEPFDFNF